MIKLLCSALLIALGLCGDPHVVSAQSCSGQFQSGQVCNNPTGFQASPIATYNPVFGNPTNQGSVTLYPAAGSGAPSAPVNGQLWTNATGVFARINGVTVGPFIGSGSDIFSTPHTWTALQTFNAGIAQSIPLSGSAALGNVNSLIIPSDTQQCTFCTHVYSEWHYGGASAKGARSNFFGWMIQTAPNTGAGTTALVAGTFVGQSNTGEAGSTIFGINPVVRSTGPSQNSFAVESDVMTDSGYTGQYQAAVTASNFAVRQGSIVDAGFLIYSGGQIPAAGGGGPWGPGVGFHCGLCFAELSSNTLVPIDSGGTLVGSKWTSISPPTVNYGIDLGDGATTGFNFTTAAFRSKGFSVDGSGTVFIGTSGTNSLVSLNPSQLSYRSGITEVVRLTNGFVTLAVATNFGWVSAGNPSTGSIDIAFCRQGINTLELANSSLCNNSLGNLLLNALTVGSTLTTAITGSTQCLQVNTLGVVSGTGTTCGAGSVSFGNPTASVGLAAVNGVATSAMRSDGAPALSQAIVPTWSGLHTFSAGLTVSAGTLTASGGSIIATSLTLSFMTGSSQCVQVDTSGHVSGTGAPCGSGSGAVNSVTNSDGTLTISPTTGAVVASINLAHANTWTGKTTFTIASTIASASGAILDDVNIAVATTTITGSVTTTALHKVAIYQPTLTDGSAVTVTNADTLYIDNAPSAAGSVTITNAWALRIGTGRVNFPASGLYNNGTAPTGSGGGYVLATGPTVSALVVTGSFTATGLVTNADLVNASITINGTSCTLGGSCSPAAASIIVGTTTVSGGTGGNIFFNNSGVLGEKTPTGTGSVVLATSPTVSGLTVTGSFTATGLVTNADLVNASVTVNGVTCTLGSTCSITATAASITTGTTTVISGVTNQLLYNNGGVLGEVTKGNNCVYGTNGTGVPACVTTLPSAVTASSLTSVGTLTGGATGAGFTIALSVSTITGTLGVANGGTGATTFTSQAILIGNGTGAIQSSGCSIDTNPILTCTSSTTFMPEITIQSSSSGSDSGYLVYNKSISGGAVTAGTFLGNFAAKGFANGGFNYGANIGFNVASAPVGSLVPTNIIFQTTSSAALLGNTLIFDSTGSLTISGGTASVSTGTGSFIVQAGGIGISGSGFFGGAILSTNPTSGIGYTTGSGGAVTQTASRTNPVTLNKVSGDITLVSAAGTTSFQSFTINNTTIGATDSVSIIQKSGTDRYMIWVTNITGGTSFTVNYATISGTTTEQPVFHFNIIKGANN